MTTPPGYLQDAKGRLVPERLVKPAELLEDQTVRKILAFARDLSAQIARFRGHCFDDVATFMGLLAAQYGDTKGGAKGNVTLTSYDGCLKVQIQVADNIVFGPELQVARRLLDQCIAAWSGGADEKIRALVDHAFQVDREGRVNREAILSLRRLEIQDETWAAAMRALTDSIRVTGSKSYMRFYERDRPEDPWRAVTIDLASAGAAEGEPPGRTAA